MNVAKYPFVKNTPTPTQSLKQALFKSRQNDLNICPFTSSYLKSAAVPMWAFYQFLISVVLLRILIVMMTITYRKIYDDLEKQWK